MSYSRISAFLSLDISSFQSGLDKASGLAARFKSLLKVGSFGSLGGLVGSAAIVQAFRSTVERAQAARDAAEKLNRTVDSGTASVARYADQWDRLKTGIGDAAVVGLSYVTRAGEQLGSFVSQLLRPDGQNAAQVRRTMSIGERAGRRADQLSSPEALEAAAARGAQKRAAAAREEEQRMRDVARTMNEADARREATRREALPVAQQLAELERDRARYQREFADVSRSALARAEAFNSLSRTDQEIARKRIEQEREIAAWIEKQDAAVEKVSRAKEKQAGASERLLQAWQRIATAEAEMANARRDAAAPSLADVSSGRRGTNSTRATVARILRDEETSRRLYDSQATVSIWDEKNQRNMNVGWEYFQDRAQQLRTGTNLQSGDRIQFSGQSREQKKAWEEFRKSFEEWRKFLRELQKAELSLEEKD
jgi:hypothetical protein